MGNIKDWLVEKKIKRLIKAIERNEEQLPKFEKYVKTCKQWIKRDKKELNKMLKKITTAEYIKIAQDTGYLEI